MADEIKKDSNLEEDKSKITDNKAKPLKRKTNKRVKAKLKEKKTPETVSKKEFDKISTELADRLQENLELQDKYMRTLAEFDNFKKRSIRDVVRSIELESEKLILNILPLYDDLDRALKHGETEKDVNKLLDGFNLIKNRYIQILKVFNVEPFESEGKLFDPDLHNALMTRVDPDKDEDYILEEFEKGFMRGEKVLRHAKVIVSKKE